MLKLNNYSSLILKEVDLELESSSNLIILGNNGAGKTTLAKVLSGIIDTTSCTIDNQIISNYMEKRGENLSTISLLN